MSKMDIYNYKRAALVAARDLGYGKNIIDSIKASSDANEISKILTNARLAD